MTSDREFGWGIAATGVIAKRVGSVIAREPGMRVAAVGSRDTGRARALADELGAPSAHGSYAELVRNPEVDAIYIATPHAQHRAVAEAAFAAGKAVLCEKPLAATLADATAMVKEAQAAGVFLMEAMWMRFNPVIRRVQDIVGAGQIGEVRTINASFGFPQPYDPASRLWDPQQGGGALLDLGVYPVALAHLLLGDPEAVHVTGALAENGVDAEAALMMTWPGGARAFLETSLVNLTAMTATVSGTRGWIEVGAPFHAATHVTVRTSPTPEEHRIESADEAFAAELREVRDLVSRGATESPVMPLDATLAVMRLLEDARDSLGAVPFA
ncbi:Gfo/Idh/MocA family oxidoreductase [Yinghuangia sp. ASG 101]|uniref:Gfo/Idh/MocA family protein n=1 Tax=Yinghuangia sp. ASG 101 TaxID=2896848 RepID=UPI001E315F82|nr:Gfo/Idh/MocA family oxidoreductase [Yinghuangia sp. ASG 101]UGQ11167.1 Gfo/Idh/MocA family oxidoreductase [Yinghuangia sp. ASG 101]